jgi:hypothetical protein
VLLLDRSVNMSPLTADELQCLKPKELIERANAVLRKASQQGPLDAGLWLEAQMYLDEHSGRVIRRHTWWMTLLTLVVTVATLVNLWATLKCL